jgi:hypothetical protein
MLVESDRPRLFTLWRGLLCLLLTLAFVTSASWELGDHIDTHDNDRVSDGDGATGGAWFGRGAPRIVKQSPGVDYLAIHVFAPDVIAQAPWQPCVAGTDEPIPNRSACRDRGASVRGPPRA